MLPPLRALLAHGALALVLAGPFGFAGCRTPTAAPGDVQHVVLVWLKHPGDAVHRARLIEVSKSFEDLPGVEDVRVGTSLQSSRAAVDDSFDVALVMTFRDSLALANYLAHPRHVMAVNEVFEPFVERVVIYDFELR